MQQGPTKALNRILARYRPKHTEMKIVLCERYGMLLQQPTMLGNHTSCWLKTRRHCVCAADSFAEACHSEQIVADSTTRLAEIICDPCLDLLGRVRWKHWPHANGQLVLPPQPQRVFLIRQVTGVDDTCQPETVGVCVQVGRSAYFILRSLAGLQSRQ